MKYSLRIIAQILILALCVTYLCHDLDFAILMNGLRTISWQGVAGLLGLIALDYLAMGLRMRSLVPTLAYRSAVAVEIVGNGMNVLLPAKLGEIIKISALARKAGISAATGTHFVFWTRFSELNILFLLALCMLNQSLLLFFLAILLCWGGLLALWFTPALPFWLLGKVPIRGIRHFLTELARLLSQRPRFFPRLLAYSAVVWLLYWAQYAWGLSYFLATPLSPGQITIIFLAASGVAAIPSTPGALGPYEATLVFLLTSFGAGKEDALVFSLCMRVFLYVPVALAALALFLRWRVNAAEPVTLKVQKSVAP